MLSCYGMSVYILVRVHRVYCSKNKGYTNIILFKLNANKKLCWEGNVFTFQWPLLLLE